MDFVKDYIAARGGVEHLREEEKKALAGMISESIIPVPRKEIDKLKRQVEALVAKPFNSTKIEGGKPEDRIAARTLMEGGRNLVRSIQSSLDALENLGVLSAAGALNKITFAESRLKSARNSFEASRKSKGQPGNAIRPKN